MINFYGRRFGLLLISVITLTSIAHSAQAELINATINGSKPRVIHTFAVWLNEKGSCLSGTLPQFTITHRPRNGRLTLKRGRVSVNEAACKGKRINGYKIIYQPNRGFRGFDQGSVKFRWKRHPKKIFQKYGTRKFEYVVDVK
ncbi:MAG: hypothetical protein ABJQ85_02510 [Rhizobiaceae bacterium]